MQYLKNVSTLKLDSSKCTGCYNCTFTCPHAVFEMQNKKAVIRDKNDCMECGACQKNCEAGAIQVQSGVGCAAAIINSVFGASVCDC